MCLGGARSLLYTTLWAWEDLHLGLPVADVIESLLRPVIFALTLVGGAGLVYGQTWSYYVMYGATILGFMIQVGTSYVPLIYSLVPEMWWLYAWYFANSAVTVALLACHATLIVKGGRKLQVSLRTLALGTIIMCVVLALAKWLR